MNNVINLDLDDSALIRAAMTSMDQSYGKTAAGYALQAIDNSGQGRAQTWQTPPGFKILNSIEDPSMGGKFVIYKNDTTNQLILTAMGTNGNSDAVGWLANLKDLGLSQWRSTAVNENGETVQQRVYKALNAALVNNAKLVLAGDSKGGAIVQFIAHDIVRDRDNGFFADPRNQLNNLAALANDHLAIVAHNGPGSEDVLRQDDPGFSPTSSKYAGIDARYYIARTPDGSSRELVSQAGGDYLGNSGSVYVMSSGVGTDAAQVAKSPLMAIYLHRLTESGYDGMAALGGHFSAIPKEQRPKATVAELAAIASVFASAWQGEAVNSLEAKARIGAGLVCAVALAPAAATAGALKGKFGLETVLGTSSLLLWATGLGEFMLASCGLAVAGANGAKYLGDGKGGLVTSGEDLASSISRAHAPSSAPSGSSRYFGHTKTGGTYVFDASSSGVGGMLYCTEQGVLSTAQITDHRLDIKNFDVPTGKALSDGYFLCRADGSTTLVNVAKNDAGQPVQVSTTTTDVQGNQSSTSMPFALATQNPITLDIQTDTTSLKPNIDTGSVGGSTGSTGLLQAGAGYEVAAAANYVDLNGLANTALSNIMTGGIRPGHPCGVTGTGALSS